MRNENILFSIELKSNENFAKMKNVHENEVKTFIKNTSKFAKENFRQFFFNENFDETTADILPPPPPFLSFILTFNIR